MPSRSVFSFVALPVFLMGMTSCSVVEDTGLFTRGSAFGDSSKSRKTEVATDSTKVSSSEKEKADREAKKAATARKAAAEAKLVALKNKELEAAKRKLEENEKERTARAADESAEKEKASVARLQERENAKLAKAEARRKAEEARASRELEELAFGGGGGFFSRLAMGTPSQYKSKGHDVYVNQRVLQNLEPGACQWRDRSEQREFRLATGRRGAVRRCGDALLDEDKRGHRDAYRVCTRLSGEPRLHSGSGNDPTSDLRQSGARH